MAEGKVHIEIDGGSGFCFGVVNAISQAERSLAGGGGVACLGDIVHNRLEVQRLEAMGLRTVRHEELEGLAGGRVLIRAHGEPPSTYEKAARLGIEVIDATCPVVAGLQRTVAAAYAEMQACGGQVVILGKRGHAEVVGLAGHADGRAVPTTSMRWISRVRSISSPRPRRVWHFFTGWRTSSGNGHAVRSP